MKVIEKEEFDEYKKYLEDSEIKYALELSRSVTIIRCKLGDYKTIKNKLTPKQLGFINRVKHHIQKTIQDKNYIKTFWKKEKINIVYSDWKNGLKVGSQFDNIYEVDIKGAYWTEANKRGLLTKELYDEGKGKKMKPIRVIALGSLAKKKYKYRYIPKTKSQKFINLSVNKKNKRIWDGICNTVGNAIVDVRKSLSDNDFIFFWVDGIYFKGDKNIKEVLSIFKKHGFKCKVRNIYRIKVEIDTKNKTNAKTLVIYEDKKQFKEKSGRPFFLSKEAFD